MGGRINFSMKRLKATAIASILGGVLVHLAVLTVIRIEGPAERTPFQFPAPVQYVGNLSGETPPAILEQAALFDSAPLFMPPRWNLASEVSEVASLREATEIFDRYSPQLLISEAVPSYPEDPDTAKQSQNVAFPSGPAFILSRFGRSPQSLPATESAGASFLLRRMDASMAKPLPAPGLPVSIQALAPPTLWTPVQFYLQISEGMPAGLPLLAQSSGFADWDKVLQAFIGSFGFYRKLGDGYYHLIVYP